MKKTRIIILLCAAVFLSCGPSKNPQSTIRSWVNLEHLDGLCEDIRIDSLEVSIVHIYSEYPSYSWVDAGREGIACVDDAARAAVLYMMHSEWTGELTRIPRIRGLLNFVTYMQSGDGGFWNFIDANHAINIHGTTSLNSFNFWAARGYWALGYGARFFTTIDSGYANLLRKRFLRCREPVRQMLSGYGRFEDRNGRKYPEWLVNEHGTDATSEYLLGLIEFLKIESDTMLTAAGLKLSEGVMDMQLGEDVEGPFPGAFLSWLDLWHAWGNSQTAALAGLGALLSKPDLLEAAKQEAGLFYPALIDSQFFSSFALNGGNTVEKFPQIAYGVRPVVSGLTALCKATGEKKYADKAGLAAAWLFGRNAAGLPMYDRKTGRCFDGIESEHKVNVNAGAESTIEALMTLVEIGRCGEASRSLVGWTRENRDVIKRKAAPSKRGQ